MALLFIEVDNCHETPEELADKLEKYARFLRRKMKDTDGKERPMWRTRWTAPAGRYGDVPHPPVLLVFNHLGKRDPNRTVPGCKSSPATSGRDRGWAAATTSTTGRSRSSRSGCAISASTDRPAPCSPASDASTRSRSSRRSATPPRSRRRPRAGQGQGPTSGAQGTGAARGPGAGGEEGSRA
ncbi:hypothetical protein NKH18_01005 [Streptomyces sp. M10(2022)]